MAIARLAEVDRDVTSIKCFPIDYEKWKCIFILAVSGVTRKGTHGTEVMKGGRTVVRPVYRKKFADRGMFRLYAEQVWQLFPERGDDSRKYPLLQE